MKDKLLAAALLVPALLLLVPFTAMRFTAEVNWSGSDFVIAYVLLAGAGLTFWAVTKRAPNGHYRAATAIAVGAGLLLIWVNLAVGFIGDEDNPANLMYGGVLALGAAGALLGAFRPLGMARAMFATAAAQFLVPIIALIVWRPNFDPNVAKIFLLNGFWVFLFATSGVLYRKAASDAPRREEINA